MPKKSLSALKRHRQSERRRLRNRAVKSTLKSLIKKVHLSVTSQDKESAKTALAGVSKALNKAASKGVIHKNTSSRRISRLTKMVDRLVLANELPLQGNP
ncbi:MAG: 30S ribosomal protein S20 [Nitrospirae bacterium]|nr:30S ribosomal protein S20 [Nitrospirota bacterium]